MEETKLGIEINWSKCTGCATCVRTEGEGAIEIGNCVAVVVCQENIRNHHKLVKECPAKAITLTGQPDAEKVQRKSGSIFGRYFKS